MDRRLTTSLTIESAWFKIISQLVSRSFPHSGKTTRFRRGIHVRISSSRPRVEPGSDARHPCRDVGTAGLRSDTGGRPGQLLLATVTATRVGDDTFEGELSTSTLTDGQSTCRAADTRELERRLPDQVTTSWWKEERGERIFVDYNQNARDRTIASAYSIRPKPGATVLTVKR